MLTLTLALSMALGQADSARMSQLRLLRPTAWYVNAGGSDTRDCRSPARPCRTIQRACDQVPDEICDAATIYVDGGTYTSGCRREGLRRCSHAGADGGVVWGTLDIVGQSAAYGTGTITAVTNGAMATCTSEAWTLSANYAGDEIATKWIAVTSGTGSGTDRKWPVRTNTAGPGSVATLQAQGEITTHPVNGSGYTVYSAPATVISGELGQTLRTAGPEGTGQASAGAAFVLSSDPGVTANGAASDRWITLQSLTVTGSTNLVRANGGVVNVREVAHQSTGTLFRGLTGRAAAAVERNIITAAGPVLVLRNTSFGVDTGMAQVYNNLCSTAVTNFVAIGSGAYLWSQSNNCAKGRVRTGRCDNCRSVGDVLGFLRVTGELDPGTSPQAASAVLALDGLTLGDATQTYMVDVYGRSTVQVDQIGGACASTVTTAAGGHVAALAAGAHFVWAPTTTFTGPGTEDIVPTLTTGAVLITAIQAAKPKVATWWDGSMARESGGSFGSWTPLLSLGAGSTLDGVQCDRGTATAGGVLAVTFSPAFGAAPRSCLCVDENAAPVACGVSVAATTAGVTFQLGAARADAVGWCCVGAR